MISPMLPREGPDILPRSGPQVEGDSFGRMLDAIEARVPELALPEAAGGEAIAMGRPHADARALDAQVFNEQGFFGKALASPAGGAVKVKIVDTDSPAVVDDSIVATPGMAAAPEDRLGPRLVGHAVGPTAQDGGSTGMPFARNATAVMPLSAYAAPRAAQPVELDRTEAPHRLTGPKPRHPVAGAQSSVAVVLHELSTGLHVAARIEALDESERTRLRDEIAALLARHGLSATSIQIGAPPARAPGQRNAR